MPSFSYRFLWLMIMTATLLCLPRPASAQEETPTKEAETEPAESTEPEFVPPLDDEGRLVRFERDVAPILRTHCLECHGPQDAKNDFRVDDPDSISGYVEAEDYEASSMYIDYLVTDDEDMLMPPKSHGGPLSAGDLALIRVWIQEGADWPDGYEMEAGSEADKPEEPAAAAPKTLPQRVWTAQGFLHPATVHFPIAMFLLGGFFVVVGWKWPAVGTQIPLACLLLGSLTAVASTLMGWSFADVRGYGSSWSFFDWEREINVHRMSGAIVTVLSVIVAFVAIQSLWKDSEKLTRYWKIGLLLLAGMVGAVGHQGGELHYGKDFYPKALHILLGTTDTEVAAADSEDGDPKEEGQAAASDDAATDEGSEAEDSQADEDSQPAETASEASEDSAATASASE